MSRDAGEILKEVLALPPEARAALAKRGRRELMLAAN
jgi:hypothetical protein